MSYISITQGHDTTAMAMSWGLYFLGLNPDIQVIHLMIQFFFNFKLKNLNPATMCGGTGRNFW